LFHFRLPATAVAGFHIPPLRGWDLACSWEALTKCWRKVWSTEGTGVHGGNPELTKRFSRGVS